ncbi:MAG: TetR/AcrR family transcriptional regulator [Hyphomicrobiaceae bacterium]
MPYTTEHKQETRARIVECARHLFNRRGFAEVSIDEIMAEAGLTRGGFYNHFKTKEDLYAETMEAFAGCNPTDRWDDVSVDFSLRGPELARQMVNGYVSRSHLEDIEGHCPLIALPSDVARAGPAVKAVYEKLLKAMSGIFIANMQDKGDLTARKQGLAIAATCVGAMVLARTVDDNDFANEICDAARAFALDYSGWEQGSEIAAEQGTWNT